MSHENWENRGASETQGSSYKKSLLEKGVGIPKAVLSEVLGFAGAAAELAFKEIDAVTK